MPLLECPATWCGAMRSDSNGASRTEHAPACPGR